MRARLARHRSLLAIAAWSLAGCRSRPSPDPLPAASAGASASGGATPSPSAATAGVRDSDARAVLDRWIAAQNGGDFAAYDGLYATKFEGVKRSGPRTRRFDRGGWMNDRRGMFAKKMIVEASDVEVVPGSATARVRFVQAWSSGEFSDRGPKELVLVTSGGALKIAREEMLRSTVASRTVPPIDRQRFAFIVHAGSPRMVLETNAHEAWLSGAPRLVSDASPVVAESRYRPAFENCAP